MLYLRNTPVLILPPVGDRVDLRGIAFIFQVKIVPIALMTDHGRAQVEVVGSHLLNLDIIRNNTTVADPTLQVPACSKIRKNKTTSDHVAHFLRSVVTLGHGVLRSDVLGNDLFQKSLVELPCYPSAPTRLNVRDFRTTVELLVEINCANVRCVVLLHHRT